MRVVSVNVGRPQTVEWRGQMVSTAIFKAPVDGPLEIVGDNLAGDAQADLSVHGGAYKAIYAYPSEHYALWRQELPDVDFGWGMFGENLTVEGLDETIGVGALLEVGAALLRVTEPRVPCYKLGLRFGRPDMVKRFLRSRRSGFYLAVERPGMIQAGDPIRVVDAADGGVTVADLLRVYGFDGDDRDTIARIVATPAVPPLWREFLGERLSRL